MDPRHVKHFNELLNSLPQEELNEKGRQQQIDDDRQFEELKAGLENGVCSYCGNQLGHFSVHKPCFHWLLNPKGFKKKHFPILFEDKSFHQIEAYLRWVANCEKTLVNINDLVEEKSPSKIIEETIKYKNLEWSFSCSKGCFKGLEHKYEGKFPHYHFQMRVDGQVMINYNGFHIPFTEYDFFSFAIKDGKFDKLRAAYIHGAGMQSFMDGFTDEEIIENVRYTDNEETAHVRMGTLIVADEGTTISGDEIADLMEERKRTGESMAKLIRRIKNVTVTTTIEPGPGVPEIASRTPNRSKK